MSDASVASRSPRKTISVDPIRYADYIDLLLKVFNRLRSYYSGPGPRTLEEESMALYAEKFITSIRALRLKFRWSPIYLGQPGVDVQDSGFPGFYDIMRLETDLVSREERLPKMPPLEDLKGALLNHVMGMPLEAEQHAKYREKLASLRGLIAERAYLEMLDLRTIFYMFTPGKLFPVLTEQGKVLEKNGRRAYHFSWGCYDPDSNRPCVYFLYLEQDTTEQMLNAKDNPEFVTFLRVVQHIGGRAPINLRSIAVALDESFSSGLYPKVLKRITVGPLISPLLYKGEHAPTSDSAAARILPLFQQAALGQDDFVVFLTAELVTSDREEEPTLLGALGMGRRKHRQIFYVPRNDQALVQRGAALMTRHALMPHRLRQHLRPDKVAKLPEFKGVDFLTYQPETETVENVG